MQKEIKILIADEDAASRAALAGELRRSGFNSIEEAASVCSPIRQFQKSGEMNKMNVVVMILESFGKENFGFFNKH